jgi:hypothetical protein
VNEVVLEKGFLPVSPVLLCKLPFQNFPILVYLGIMKFAMALTRQDVITTWSFKFKNYENTSKFFPGLN